MKLNHYQDCTSIEYEQVCMYVCIRCMVERDREREREKMEFSLALMDYHCKVLLCRVSGIRFRLQNITTFYHQL